MSSSAEHGAHPPGAAEPAPLPAQPPLPPPPRTQHRPTAPKPLHGTAPPAPASPPQRRRDPETSSAVQERQPLAARDGDTYTCPRRPRQSCRATCTTRSCPPRRRRPRARGLLLLPPPGTAHPASSSPPGRRGLSALAAHLSPKVPPPAPGVTPLQPGPGLSPCPHAGPGPPRADNGGALAAERCQRAWSCSSVARAALWVPPGSRQGFGFDVTRIKRAVGRALPLIFLGGGTAAHPAPAAEGTAALGAPGNEWVLLSRQARVCFSRRGESSR